jgi:TonB family protein
MTYRVLLLTLLLVGAAVAQDSAPVSLSGKDHPPICRGKESDAGCVTPPHATYAPNPEYPKKESKARNQGSVVVDLIVDADGLPRDINVSRPLSHDFDEAAINAVKTWKFSPAIRDGKPIAAQIKVEVSFRQY